jgi:S-adenosylmethionine:tRNA ribosyltransferase-isomerase
MHTLQDYTYILPEHLIAQTPADPPESCKLLVYDNKTNQRKDVIFSDIVQDIDPQSLIIFNNTKVVKARIQFDNKEIFFLKEITPYTFEALVRP